jgi:hypothetical protein
MAIEALLRGAPWISAWKGPAGGGDFEGEDFDQGGVPWEDGRVRRIPHGGRPSLVETPSDNRTALSTVAANLSCASELVFSFGGTRGLLLACADAITVKRTMVVQAKSGPVPARVEPEYRGKHSQL